MMLHILWDNEAMADLNLRLGLDVLTIAENARNILLQAGLDVDADANVTLAIEPEVVENAIAEDLRTGAQCVVTNVINFNPSALRKMKALDEAETLAKKSAAMTQNKQVQHPLVRIFPSELPLDPTSKQSLNEHADEYKFVAKLFNKLPIDGFLLHGFENETEIKCALIGIRKVSDKTIIYDKRILESSDDLKNDTKNLESCSIEDSDYSPASSKIAVFDYDQIPHIDALLDTATSEAESGTQFLLVKNASPSKTAAVCALTSGWEVKG